MFKTYYVYILTNPSNTVLYIGVTNNLLKRIDEHKQKLVIGFTKRYNLNKLIYFESTQNIEAAIKREKQLKGWSRSKKIVLINDHNPSWNDLGEKLI